MSPSPPPLAQDPAELLAVVDHLDREIGAERRDVIHRTGLLHRAVHVILTGPGGGILLQQRSAEKDTYPLHWECVGGHLGPGETYEEAAMREVGEEVGCAATDFVRLGKHGPSDETGQEFIEVWTARITGAPNPPSTEVIEVLEAPWANWKSEIISYIEWLATAKPQQSAGAPERRFAPGPIASFHHIGWLD